MVKNYAINEHKKALKKRIDREEDTALKDVPTKKQLNYLESIRKKKGFAGNMKD